MLGAVKSTKRVTLRCEVGASAIRNRTVEGKLQDNGKLLKDVDTKTKTEELAELKTIQKEKCHCKGLKLYTRALTSHPETEQTRERRVKEGKGGKG